MDEQGGNWLGDAALVALFIGICTGGVFLLYLYFKEKERLKKLQKKLVTVVNTEDQSTQSFILPANMIEYINVRRLLDDGLNVNVVDYTPPTQ
jgi:O-antigen/teichoic acid export membrane protein